MAREKAMKFVWYELMTSDPAVAEDFYSHIVGWGARDAGMPNLHYTLFTAGTAPVAGLMALPSAGARPGWVGYVGVSDVDADLERIRQAGGAVHHAPQDIPGVGRFTVVADPQGAVFAIFAASMPSRPAPPMTPGHINWHELHAADGAAAFEFYSPLFGWKKSDAIELGPIGVYQLFNTGGPAIGAIFTKPPAEPAPYWLYYFTVPDIEIAVGRIKEKRGKVIHGPQEVPGGLFTVQGVDPQGATFALVARPK
jgi:uncharacterized protein